MSKKLMKKCSSFMALKEMQIKTTLRFHLTLVRIAINNTTNKNIDQDVVKKEPSCSACGNVS
jgi:hypothetical protein